jgi:DNA repair exonuclease SbcCD ATPase subunit
MILIPSQEIGTMRNTVRVAAVITILCALAAPVVRTQEEAAPGPLEHEREVEIIRFQYDGRTVVGRPNHISDTTIFVHEPDGEERTYVRKKAKNLRTMTIPRSRYLELRADTLYSKFNEGTRHVLDKLLHIRRLYQHAHVIEQEPERREVLDAKLKAVDEDRRVVQEEQLMREKLEREELETELVRAEKRLVEKKLAAIDDHEKAIRKLQDAYQELARTDEKIADFAERVGKAVEDLAEDVDDLEDRSRHYLTRAVVIDLKDDIDDIEDDIDRIKRAIRDLQRGDD